MTPTNLFTGFLGVGKTTSLLHLLQYKPAHERWAVLVNEFGEVGIDGAILEGGSPDGVVVREVGGGCFCCTTAPYLPVALHFLFVDSKPDRLLIEASGLGHPAGIIDTLRENYADRLDLRATIGLVAPADFTCDGMLENPIFRDQIQLADVLVLNKCDVAGPGVLAAFQTWANSLFPPKLLIAATEQGRLDPAWLNLNRHREQLLRLRPASASTATPPATDEDTRYLAEPGRPQRYATATSRTPACGWIFDPADRFREQRLMALFANWPSITRLKGVFRVEHEWIVVNRVGTAVSVQSTTYRRDSRLEVIVAGDAGDWDQLEQGLLACLMPQD